MSLLVLGLNHRTAALDLREMLTIEKEQLAPSLDLLSHYVEHGVLVSTCNRLEIYTYDRNEPGLVQRIGDFLTASSGVAGTTLEEHLTIWRERNVPGICSGWPPDWTPWS